MAHFKSYLRLLKIKSEHRLFTHVKNSSVSLTFKCHNLSVAWKNCKPTTFHSFPLTLYNKAYVSKIVNGIHCTRCLSSQKETIMNVFDRKAKRMQRNRTALLKDYTVFDYVKEEIGYRVADRICDVKRKFDVAVDLGCGRGHVSKHIYSDMVGTLIQTDMAEKVLAQSEPSPEVPTIKLHVDEEFLPFAENSLDLVVSSLSLHWVNDLPGCLKQIFRALKKDGCLLGAIYGGDTLFELRVALQLAETEKEGGFSPHISPFTSAQDLGGLLTRAGYVMLTVDVDELVINYPSMFELMQDLKGMGENNCSWSRRLILPKVTQKGAAKIYKDMYGNAESESVPATFQVLNFIAWKPDASQQPVAQRGSGQVSLKDLDKLDQLSKQIEDAKSSMGSPGTDGAPQPDFTGTLEKLSQDIEKLRQSTVTSQLDDTEDNSGDDKKNS